MLGNANYVSRPLPVATNRLASLLVFGPNQALTKADFRKRYLQSLLG